MGMIFNLLRVTGTELDSYLEDSSLLEQKIYNDETEEEDPNLVDIDKAWEGILFLLTGQNLETMDHPLASVLFSEQVIDDEQDLGYGPAQYVTPEQVKALHEQISTIMPAELAKRYDAKKMTELELYPNAFEDENMLDYLLEYFTTVQEVYAEAARNDEAIITFIS